MEIILLTIDLHVHTTHSGDATCSVKKTVDAAKEKGLDGIAITDHDTVSGVEEALRLKTTEDFLIIPGVEISSKDGHILGLGIREKIPSNLSAEITVEKIRERGGVSVSAHPFSLGLRSFSALRADFDAIEVFNSRRYIGNKFAKKYAYKNSLPAIGGSDAHYCDEIGLAGIEVNSEPKVELILKKIKEGKVSVFGRYLPLTNYLRRALRIFLRL